MAISILDTTDIVQTIGDDETKVMSQKVVTEEVTEIKSGLTNSIEIHEFENKGYYIFPTTGELWVNGEYDATDFIPYFGGNILLKGFYNGSSSCTIAFYDSNKTFISGVTGVKGNIDIQVSNVPESTSYIRCSTRTAYSDNPTIICNNICDLSKKIDDFKKSVNSVGALKNLNILIFGDSITDNTIITVDENHRTTSYTERTESYTNADGQVVTFNKWATLMQRLIDCNEVRNYALSGAGYKEYETYVGTNLERRNVSTQVEIALNDLNNPNGVFKSDNFTPDIVIFALGINDRVSNSTYEAAMSKTVVRDKDGNIKEGVSIGTVEGDYYDIEATLNNLDKSKCCETMRYCFLKTKQAFPMATFICVIPAQQTYSQGDDLATFREQLKKMAQKYGMHVIDGYGESGIVMDFEKINGLGTYLKDGLHPNEKGQNLYARMIVQAIKKYHISLNGLN